MRDNFVFLVIFDTCDVVYDWLPSIVLGNLFVYNVAKLGAKCNMSSFVHIIITKILLCD